MDVVRRGLLMKVMVLGVSGMLGSAVFRVLSGRAEFETFGTARSGSGLHTLPEENAKRIEFGVDAENVDALVGVLNRVRPAAVVNCIGVVKQLAASQDPLHIIPVNAIVPHRLADLCRLGGS